MAHYYTISARAVRKGEFEPEPGTIRYLKSPQKELPKPAHEISAKKWIEEVRDLADGQADCKVSKGGDVVIFVHGYNNDARVIRDRQLQLAKDLGAEQWHGVVVSFDWPSADSTLNYLEDRKDAARVAQELVSSGIRPLAANQLTGCETNVHLVGHSTGAYVIMEAFAQSEKDGKLFKQDWRIAQVAFIGADVGAGSLAADSDWAAPMFKRVMRLTNYQNPFDHVLATSNAKRLGTAPRVGRVGLPSLPHPKSTNVDCGEYFTTLDPKKQTFFGTFAHSWHIGDRVFARDLAMTLEGRIDRHAIPTRKKVATELVLQDRPRPAHYGSWALPAPPK
jgi:esterase/lipase superfamily enzyme